MFMTTNLWRRVSKYSWSMVTVRPLDNDMLSKKNTPKSNKLQTEQEGFSLKQGWGRFHNPPKDRYASRDEDAHTSLTAAVDLICSFHTLLFHITAAGL